MKTRVPLKMLAGLALLWGLYGQAWASSGLRVMTLQAEGQALEAVALDAVVEAVRHTTVSAQVAGAVSAVHVKAGDRVKAGQALLRLDARAAQQGLTGTQAQVEAAQAALKVATQELERQERLLAQKYISQAAHDKARSQFEAAQAQLKAAQANTQVAQTQLGFYTVQAPYDGIVSEVPVSLGDMAMPGRPLVTVHDPRAMRISAAVPQALLDSVRLGQKKLRFELPSVSMLGAQLQPQNVQLMPAIDPGTHTGTLRIGLSGAVDGLVPGLFARVWLPLSSKGKQDADRLYVPKTAVVRRVEMTGVYVVDAADKTHLRLVRLGPNSGDQVEVLSGLRKGERIALEPQRVGANP
jgi:membrane fusion protein, multidrug efflux system